MAKKLIEGQMTIFKFLGKDSKEREVKIPFDGIVFIMQSLDFYRKYIEDTEPKDYHHELILKNQLEKTNMYINILEGSADFEFNKFAKKMMRRLGKKGKDDDAGMNALEAAVILHNHEEK